MSATSKSDDPFAGRLRTDDSTDSSSRTEQVEDWVHDCPVCGRSGSLVRPGCTDGHGPDCPDRLCLDCGSALFVDPLFRRTHDSDRYRSERIA